MTRKQFSPESHPFAETPIHLPAQMTRRLDMEILNWIFIVSETLTVISCAAPVAVLVYCLWAQRRSSITRALALFGVLIFGSGLSHLCDLLMYWWSVPWLAAVVKGACAAASVGFSYTLARVIPRAVEFRDLEQLAAAAADLRRSRQRFERAVVGSSSGLWEWYIDANEVWFSPRFKELLGYSDDEFPDRFESWKSALHPDDKQRTLAALKSHLNQQGAYDVDYRLLTKSGTYRWFTARGVTIHGRDGQPDLLSGSIQDIHDRMEAEGNLRRQGEYLVQKQKLASMGELAGEVAHEFNNMLQALSGQIQFAESMLALESTTRKELDIASLLIDEAVQFTRQLLDFSRPHPCKLQPISIDDCLNRLNSVLCPLLGKTIELQFCRSEGIGLFLADANSLQQALLNLCINARDAMPEGGTLTIASSRAELCERDAAKFPGANPGSYALITVTDTGCGMSEEQQARIFEPYFTTKDSGNGTGLGLTIVYSVVKNLRGIICCESQPGHGSKFSIWLPITAQPLDPSDKNIHIWHTNTPFTNDVLLNAVQNAVVCRSGLISV
jgi:PAS domain S-box-containing protein